MVGHGALKLSVREEVEVLTDRLIIIRPDDDIRAPRAGLQAGIQRRAGVRAAVELHGGAEMPGGEFDAQLHAQIVRRQKPLIAAYQLDVAQARAARTAQLG